MPTTFSPSRQPVLIAGRWRGASGKKPFRATNPSRNRPIERDFPISEWADVSAALDAAVAAFAQLRQTDPGRIGDFLETYARLVDDATALLADAAHKETGLPRQPRLPRWLRDRNPTDTTWRCIDGAWSTADMN